jgi:hypothetical protein
MRLYSKNNKDDLFDRFEIDINFPIFKCGTKYIDIKFDTHLVYTKVVKLKNIVTIIPQY